MLFDKNITCTKLPYGRSIRHITTFADGKNVGEYWEERLSNGNVINETNGTHIYKGNLYKDGELVFEYDVSKHGCVTAIKIELDDMRNSIATLAFAFEDVQPVKITWCCPDERDAFKYGITGYTVIIDNRYNRSFESYVK